MPEETPLSDLCSICNANKSKYKCSGCSARTCSLPCYKRHQQWAQCSGQRDRTKFIKKSQLVTPAGIDHDYNFLAGIERDIEKADEGLANSNGTARSWSQQHGTHYGAMEATGVNVIRAPKGMSRQIENKTHRSSTKRASGRGNMNITWTVEWLDNSKKRQLTETSSTCTIKEANQLRSLEQKKDKKRKRDLEPSSSTTSSNTQHGQLPRENQNKSVKSVQPVQLHVDIKCISQEREHPPTSERRTNSDKEESTNSKAHVEEAHRGDTCLDGSITEPVGSWGHRFFLVKPRTSSSRTVLIPLDPTATLGACLTGRTILEFPTIHVFPGSLESLPNDFILEEDYLKQEREDQKEFDQLIGELDPEILKRLKDDAQQSRHPITKEEKLNDREILDVLKKDFGAYI